ncbi:MAG: aldolase/citrate lyase family protein [Arcobacteraceae bacterium]|nr:aldolase/citrate lyase family protein [Arcobacteraceae bacterium]
MLLSKNYLKEKLENGQSVIGTWSIIPSTVTIDIIASAGVDFIIIDAEHGPISFETAQDMAIVCESRGVSPVMRVGTINEADILKALDIGVHCIQIPNVNTKKDVEKTVELSKYPPIGKRGFSPFTRAGGYSLKNAKTLTEKANKNTMIAINIEGKEAIEDIDNILKINELDILFIGLFDLSKALGIPGDVDNPIVIDYLKELTYKINASGKYAGTITTSKEKITEFLDIGIKYIVHLVDCEILRNAYTDIVNHFNDNRSN